MQFDALNDPVRIAARIEEVGSNWQKLHDQRGQIVSYSMPALPNVCPQLHQTIFGSAHRKRYFGIHYYLQSKDRHIRRVVPAPEHYKFALGSIADNRYSLWLVKARVDALLLAIQHRWKQTKQVRPQTAQSSFSVSEHVYQLKAEVAAGLFFARSLLDIFSTMSHFLYGPNSKRFSSFTSFLKHLSKQSNVEPIDPEMHKYAVKHMGWFWSLRDFRDFVTHHSSLRVEFYERDGKLDIFLEHVARPQELLGQAIEGIDRFLAFADAHFVPRFVERESG